MQDLNNIGQKQEKLNKTILIGYVYPAMKAFYFSDSEIH